MQSNKRNEIGGSQLGGSYRWQTLMVLGLDSKCSVLLKFWRDLQQGPKDLSSRSLSYTLLEQRLTKIPICKICGSKTLVILFNLLHKAVQRSRSRPNLKFAKTMDQNHGLHIHPVAQHLAKKLIEDQICYLQKLWIKNLGQWSYSSTSCSRPCKETDRRPNLLIAKTIWITGHF